METHQLYDFIPPYVGHHFSNPTPTAFFNRLPFDKAYSDSNDSVRSILDSFKLSHTRHLKLVSVEISNGDWEVTNIDPFCSSREEIGHYWCDKAPEIPSESHVLNLTDVSSQYDFNGCIDVETKTFNDQSILIIGRFNIIKPRKGTLVIKVIETDL